MTEDRAKAATAAVLVALGCVPLAGVAYDLSDHAWFAAGCFAVLSLALLGAACFVWND